MSTTTAMTEQAHGPVAGLTVAAVVKVFKQANEIKPDRGDAQTYTIHKVRSRYIKLHIPRDQSPFLVRFSWGSTAWKVAFFYQKADDTDSPPGYKVRIRAPRLQDEVARIERNGGNPDTLLSPLIGGCDAFSVLKHAYRHAQELDHMWRISGAGHIQHSLLWPLLDLGDLEGM